MTWFYWHSLSPVVSILSNGWADISSVKYKQRHLDLQINVISNVQFKPSSAQRSQEQIRHPRKESEFLLGEGQELEVPLHCAISGLPQCEVWTALPYKWLGSYPRRQSLFLLANKVQCCPSAGTTGSIYIVLLATMPSGDIPWIMWLLVNQYNSKSPFLQVLSKYLSFLQWKYFTFSQMTYPLIKKHFKALEGWRIIYLYICKPLSC